MSPCEESLVELMLLVISELPHEQRLWRAKQEGRMWDVVRVALQEAGAATMADRGSGLSVTRTMAGVPEDGHLLCDLA